MRFRIALLAVLLVAPWAVAAQQVVPVPYAPDATPQAGDTVAVKNGDGLVVLRIAGAPGDKVQVGKKSVTVPPGAYYAPFPGGRYWTLVPRAEILGKVEPKR